MIRKSSLLHYYSMHNQHLKIRSCVLLRGNAQPHGDMIVLNGCSFQCAFLQRSDYSWYLEVVQCMTRAMHRYVTLHHESRHLSILVQSAVTVQL